MNYSKTEYIKQFPHSFQAFKEEMRIKDDYGFLFDIENVVPESYVGLYLNWFLDKLSDETKQLIYKELNISQRKP